MELNDIGKSFALFVATAIAELIGCYLPMLWLTGKGTAWLLLPAAASLAAIDQINETMEVPMTIRQVKYLNKIVEQDQRAVKRITKPMLDFKSFKATKCVLAGIELMHMIRKGQLHFSGSKEMSFADQFYFLAGKIRSV